MLLLIAAPSCALTRTFYGEPLPLDAEILVAHAADGFDVPVIHYQPVGARKGLPIVLCHGISANARNMDLDAEHSLARWFAARGYETFSMSLRGTWDEMLPESSRRPDLNETNLDTYANQDLPAVLALVQQKTGAAQVDYVGHSLGGLVLYAYLARGGQGVRAAVTLGSPARLRMGSRLEPLIVERGGMVLHGLTAVPNATLAVLVAPLSGSVETPLEKLLVNLEDVDVRTWQKLLVVGTADMAGGTLRQMQKCIVDDKLESADGKIDYLAALRDVRVPVLVVAGKADHIALAGSVKAAYTALGGEKRFFVAGVENGFSRDYGHLNLTIGERAPDELWPLLQQWFERH